MKRIPVTLIFDIGKTTKKALVFDAAFQVIDEQTTHFQEIVDDDGFPAEDLSAVSNWVTEIFQHYFNHRTFEVTHCNVSSYGASFVHLDHEGNQVGPFYNYLKPFPDDLKTKFLSHYDNEGKLLSTTASPFLGLLNSGLQIFWLKYKKPEIFRNVKTSLHLPNYFMHLLTGSSFTDITSVGCHTLLWDFNTQDYHSWVHSEGLGKLFPPLQNADHVIHTVIAGRSLKTGIGVHDSSAALMPYLATQTDPFLLLSTGTWNISFNPYNHSPLTPQELAADCLCFLTFEGNPVKASRIFLGHEHDRQANSLAKFFSVPTDHYNSLTFEADVYEKLRAAEETFGIFFPLGMEGTGPIPEKQSQQTDLTAFADFKEAYHQLVRYLVRWQLLSLQLVDPDKKVKNVIVVGGFTKNLLFLEILKREEPARKILISDHPRASALGAAWLVSGTTSYSGNAGLLSVSEV